MNLIVFIVLIAFIAKCDAYFKSSSIVTKSLFRTKKTTTVLFETTADFKNGMTFEIENVPVKLMEFLHVKPGKGSAFVRTKIKNLLNGISYFYFVLLSI